MVSKFVIIAVFVLAVVASTWWCIVTFYSATYVPTDARVAPNPLTLAAPTKQSSSPEASPDNSPAPPFKTFQSSRGR
jgi:hypothetical protein